MTDSDLESKDSPLPGANDHLSEESELIRSTGLELTKQLIIFMEERKFVKPESVLRAVAHSLQEKDFNLPMEWSEDEETNKIESITTAIGNGFITFLNGRSVDVAESIYATITKSLKDLTLIDGIKEIEIKYKLGLSKTQIKLANASFKLGEDVTELLTDASEQIVEYLKALGRHGMARHCMMR